jgi:hypothetical protein
MLNQEVSTIRKIRVVEKESGKSGKLPNQISFHGKHIYTYMQCL